MPPGRWLRGPARAVGAAALLALVALTPPRSAEAAEAAQAPGVVASILPIHSLAAGVMEGVGRPHLIVPGGRSPHGYSLRPSDAEALQNAEAVIWIGPGLETFLEPAMETLAGNARHVLLSEVEGLVTLPVREDDAFEKHVHDHGYEGEHDHAEDHADEHQHEHEADHAGAGYDRDWHVWLDPHNAGVMAQAIARTLAEVDPDHAQTYRANADALTARLETMTGDIAADLAPLKDQPFIVFHDAFQYFEHRFGLRAAGAIMVRPDTPPGAARIAAIRDRVANTGAVCVFTEPQFEPRLARVIVEGTGARLGTLDPVGAGLEPGPELYFAVMTGLARDMRACLDPD